MSVVFVVIHRIFENLNTGVFQIGQQLQFLLFCLQWQVPLQFCPGKVRIVPGHFADGIRFYPGNTGDTHTSRRIHVAAGQLSSGKKLQGQTFIHFLVT